MKGIKLKIKLIASMAVVAMIAGCGPDYYATEKLVDLGKTACAVNNGLNRVTAVSSNALDREQWTLQVKSYCNDGTVIISPEITGDSLKTK